MTQEEKAKAYDEALERARKLYESYNRLVLSTDEIERIFPELAESEDERIRRGMIDEIKAILRGEDLGFPPQDVLESRLAYLEKQKEPENVSASTMIPFCWEVKRKEQKPEESISQLTVQGKGVYKICPRCKERMVRDDSMVYTSMPPQYRYECPKCGESECDTVMYDNPEMEEQKPAEWSEEDEDMLNSCISSIEEAKENRYAYKETDGDTSYDHEIAWLKSIRPSKK